MSKREIIELLEQVSPARLTVKEIYTKLGLTKGTVNSTLQRIKTKERQIYGIKSARMKREETIKGKTYISFTRKYWVEQCS